jgi:hypothetical protein
MKFYFFGGKMGELGNIKSPSNLDRHNFSGVMFTHNIPEGDMFVKTAIDINPNESIKYLIAIRPYTISPQYLSMINRSIGDIDEDRLQINLISGYIKEDEEGIEGIVGGINDQSSAPDRSKYMIDFIHSLNKMDQNKKYRHDWRNPNRKHKLDVYVSTTNKYVFETAKKYGHKIILPYTIYTRGVWNELIENSPIPVPLDLEGMEIMLAITPIIRKTEEELSLLTNYAMRPVWKKGEVPEVVMDAAYFTYEQFDDFVQTLEKRGINHLLINGVPSEEVDIIVPFIKQYVEEKKK